MKKTILAVAAILATVNGLLFGETTSEVLAPYVESGELAGAIAILEKPGARDVALAGWADPESKLPISMDSTFMQCSQTKGFCGVTIAMLVEEGKLNLDDPVSKYLPEFTNITVRTKMPDGTTEVKKPENVLTVRMCMNHTGGFDFESPTKNKVGWSHSPLAQSYKEAVATPLLFEPGTSVKYSNLGIDIGALVVEAITGKPWDEFLKERVLDPLEMHDTTFQPTEEQLARRIRMYRAHENAPATPTGYNRVPEPWNGETIYPSAGAGLWTTAADQLKFYHMLMNLGLADNGKRLLKEETVKNLLATSTRLNSKDGYSLGLKAQGDGWFGHGGALGTNAMVNWQKKELMMWVVQSQGGPRPWEKSRDKVRANFFKDNATNDDSYVGRTK